MALRAITSNLGVSLQSARWRIAQGVLLSCVLILSGCAAFEMDSDSFLVKYKKRRVFAEHVWKANKLEQQEKLADALDHWRIATAIYPESIEANLRARTLEDQINARVSELTAQADDAASRGQGETSVRLLLSALSLQPDNQALIRRVAAIKRRVAHGKVANNPSLAEPNISEENDSLEGRSIASLHAEAKYQSGVELFDTDKTRAKQLFLEALELDPTHLGARVYLQILSEAN